MTSATAERAAERLENDYIVLKESADAAKKLQKTIVDEFEEAFLGIDEVLAKSKSSILDDVKEGSAVRYKGFNVFKFNGIYGAFSVSKRKTLDEEGVKLKKEYIRKISKGEIDDEVKPYVELHPPSGMLEVDEFLKEEIGKEGFKELGMTQTAFFKIPFAEKIETAQRVAKKDLSPLLEAFAQKPVKSLRVKRGFAPKCSTGSELREAAALSFDPEVRRNAKIVAELMDIYEEDPTKQFMFVLKELKSLKIEEEMKILRYRIEDVAKKFSGSEPFGKLSLQNSIKLELVDESALSRLEKSGILVRNFDSRSFLMEHGAEKPIVRILGVSESLYEIKAAIDNMVSHIDKNERRSKINIPKLF